MNEQELERIETRAAKATPGPWEVNLGSWTVQAAERLVADTYSDDDTHFIAHARSDVPALVAEVERLTATIHNRDAVLESYRMEVERLNAENETLKFQLTQAKAAISIFDPATGTGAFLSNPPFGEKGGEG